MPDEIHANLAFPGSDYSRDPYLSICVNGNDTLGAILPRETAIEMHRRINRIPEVSADELHHRQHCAACRPMTITVPMDETGMVQGEPVLSKGAQDVIAGRMMKPGAKSMRYGTFREWQDGNADCILPDNARITEKAIARARKIAGLFAWHNGDPAPGRPRMGALLEQSEVWVGRDGTQTVLAELSISHAGAIRRLLMRRAARIQAEQAERFYRTLSSSGVADALDHIEAEFDMDPKDWMRQRPLYRTLTQLLKNAEDV
jgi:hypothetical protein